MHQWTGTYKRRFRAGWAALAAAVGLYTVAALAAANAALGPSASDPKDEDIHLEISPRICTLTGNDKQCSTPVHAQWRSNHDESLCLVILEHKEIQRCWEHYSAGTYTVDLVFTQDVVFQLRDVSLEHVLASEVLRVIREAIQYRHRRRQPWNIFD
jgi:DUF3019 family protein